MVSKAVREMTLRGAACVALPCLLFSFHPASAAAGESGPSPFLLPDRIKTETLVVLAHPDDEGVVAPLLARYALDEKQRVINIYVTRGEYGTNRVGEFQGPAFGFLRMTELHWTLDRLGVAMFHSLGRSDLMGGRDPEATLDSWDRQATIRDLVRILRLTRPDRVLTWFPGPPSGHVDHMATGAAVLLACRAAGEASSFADLSAEEDLPLHQVPEVFLFAQAEKVAYEPYPGGPEPGGGGAARIVPVPVDVFSERQGRTYADIAREAMREQRSVEAAHVQKRGGPFDQPVNLIDAFRPGELGESPEPGPIRLTLEPSPAQRFTDELLRQAGAGHLIDLFPPEVAADRGEAVLRLTAGHEGAKRFRGKVEVTAPDGWSVSPASRELDLEPGESSDLEFEMRSDPDYRGIHAAGRILISSRGRGGKSQEQPFVLTTMKRRWR